MPLNRVSTSTSSDVGEESRSGRSSPRPGAVIQNALASAIEAAFEQEIVAQREAPDLGTERGAHPLDLGQRDARPAGAEDHGRDRDLQAVQAAGGEEARDRDPAALDEHAAEAAA